MGPPFIGQIQVQLLTFTLIHKTLKVFPKVQFNLLPQALFHNGMEVHGLHLEKIPQPIRPKQDLMKFIFQMIHLFSVGAELLE